MEALFLKQKLKPLFFNKKIESSDLETVPETVHRKVSVKGLQCAGSSILRQASHCHTTLLLYEPNTVFIIFAGYTNILLC